MKLSALFFACAFNFFIDFIYVLCDYFVYQRMNRLKICIGVAHRNLVLVYTMLARTSRCPFGFFTKIRCCIRWKPARFPIPVGLPSTVIYYSFVFLCTSFLVACKFSNVFVLLKHLHCSLELTLICLNKRGN